jgi:hypothetical protein
MQSKVTLENNEKIILQGQAGKPFLYTLLIIAIVILTFISAMVVGIVYASSPNLDRIDIIFLVIINVGILTIFLWQTRKNYLRNWYVITDKRCIISTTFGVSSITNSSIREVRIYKNIFNQLFGLNFIYISTKTENEKVPIVWRFESVDSSFPVESEVKANLIVVELSQYIH